jgi:hypothetical protein
MTEDTSPEPTDLTTRLRIERDRRRFGRLVDGIPEIRFHGFVGSSEGIVTPSSLWQKITPIAAIPSARIRDDADSTEIAEWLAGALKLARIEARAYLSLGGYGLPWADVELLAEGHLWLSSLWSKLATLDLLLLRSDQRQMLAFTEEEYDYFAFLTVLNPR